MDKITGFESALETAVEKPSLPSIRLEFFRHDEKESDPGKPEQDIRLTQAGREHASSVGLEREPQADVAVVYGSPRVRSTETALRQALAGTGEISSEDSLEDIEDLVSSHLAVGKKNLVDERLNFHYGPAYIDSAMERFTGGKDYLVFSLMESDNLVKEKKDNESSCYSRQAAGIAEIVKRYFGTLSRWEQITTENPDKYKKSGLELQRFFGSHATVPETFLLKVIEKQEGKEAALEFLGRDLGKNGFGYSEGYSLKIRRDEESGEATGELSYKDKVWKIDGDLLEAIIADRDELDKSINS